MSYHELLNIIINNGKRFAKITFLSIIIIYLFLTFFYPLTYNSTASILPPEGKKGLGLGNLLAGQEDLSGLLDGASNASSQLYMEILKSRNAALYVVKKHNLKKYFNTSTDFAAAQRLSNRLNLNLTKEGIITISVEVNSSFMPLVFDNLDSLKKFSAALSNSYVEALDLINREKISSKAKRAREYIEKELLNTKGHLDSVETLLSSFQKTNKTVSLPEQIKASIESAAQLKTEIVKAEIDLNTAQNNLKEGNPALQGIRDKLQTLKNEYNKFNMGNEDYLLTFKDVPDIGKQLASLMREVKVQNELYVLLQQQYYKEKIQENRDIPTIEVLDEAIPPLSPSSPRTVFSSILGGLFVLFVLISVQLINEKKSILTRFNYSRNKKVSNV